MSEKKKPKVLEIVSGRKVEFEDKKVVTAMCRLSYPHLFVPKAYKDGDPKFSCSLLFNSDDDLSQLEIAAHNAAVEKWGSDKKQWPSKKVKSKKTGKVILKSTVAMPFKDGETEHPDKPEYEGITFIGASCKKKPSVFGQNKEALESHQIKAGDYVRASLVAFAYPDDGKGPKVGVSFAILGIQKWKNGESLGGGNSANDFDELEFDEDESMEDEDNSDNEESEDEDDEINY